jgi:hypothetical protein
MNASEIRYLEARLPATYHTLPSPEDMVRYKLQIRRERNRHIFGTFAKFVRKLTGFVRQVRINAEACTAARLHQASV